MNIQLDCKSSPLSSVSALPSLTRIARLIAVFFLAPGLCLAAGFDCNRATTLVEKLVCADQGLSQLDESLSKTYKEVLRWARDPAGFKREQVKWLREVRDLCTDGPCLEKEYRNRLAVLEKLLPEKSPADRQAHAASFDCGKAESEAEKMICGNDELSRLDKSLNKAYLQVLERTDIKKQIIKGQRQWLKNFRNACRDAECIKRTYKTRIKELEFLSSYVTIYSWNGDPVVNLAPFKPLSEPFKAILAMYALQIGSDCKGSSTNLKCELTSSVGLGTQCSKEQISLVRKWFRKEIPRMAWSPEWAYKESQKPGRLESICYNSPDTATTQQIWDTIRVGIRKNLVFVDAVFAWTVTADGPSGRTGYSSVYGIAKDRIITLSHKKVLDEKNEND
jgi:uncharacterized protein